MTTRLHRRQFLILGMGSLATVLAGGAVVRSMQGSSRGSRPAGAARLSSTAGELELDLVAEARAGTIPGGPAEVLTYNGRSPGPLLEVNPGDRVRIHLQNRLNQPTNLHFHGLHIPPTGSADNVFLRVAPGGSTTYDFTIPSNHQAGLFYLHPHQHGVSADQVFGGLAGTLIVRGALDRIPEVAAASEHVLVFKDFASGSANPGSAMGMGRMLGREGPLLTVNGALNPELSIASGGLLRLRLLNASNARIYRLALEGHTMQLIATDGGAIAKPEPLEELLLAPGERADVLVQGNQRGGSYSLQALPYQPSGHMGMGTMGSPAGSGSTLATVRYKGAVKPLALPMALIPVPEMPAPERTRRFVMAHAMGGMGSHGMGMGFQINGASFDPSRIDTRVELGSTEDWVIVNNDMMDHPFHLHTNSFQIVNSSEQLPAQRAWKDTILLRAGQEARIRVTFQDFPGRTVYHCHNLDHEDLGLMGVLQIDGKPS